MAKNKLKRFVELSGFATAVDLGSKQLVDDHPLKGNWAKDFFMNVNPIILEIGCGKGEYTLGLAERYPLSNYLGIDIKGARIWKGAKQALQNEITNAGFIRCRVENIGRIFAEKEITEIWLTFPDPYSKKSNEDKRLTSTKFLEIYRSVLIDNGAMHLKTDDSDLYEFTLNTINKNGLTVLFSTNDLAKTRINDERLRIRTYYEGIHSSLGKPICYIRFCSK